MAPYRRQRDSVVCPRRSRYARGFDASVGAGAAVMRFGLVGLVATTLHGQTFSPSPLNFGAVKLGATVMKSTVLTAGATSLAFAGGGAMSNTTEFSWVSDCATATRTLAPGGTCTFT